MDLWYALVPSSLDASLAAAYEALLQPDEARRYAAFRFEHGRREYLLTRALARFALSQYAEVAPRDWRFVRGPHGRPEITPPGRWRFNLANCPGLVVCAIADARSVGVDAEPHERGAAILGMADRVFSAAELASLRRLGSRREQELRAVWLWTLKEAHLKASGAGLSIPLRSVSFEAEREPVTASVDGARVDAVDFASLDVAGHRVAAAVGRAGPAGRAVRVWETTPLVSAQRRPELEGSVRSSPAR